MHLMWPFWCNLPSCAYTNFDPNASQAASEAVGHRAPSRDYVTALLRSLQPACLHNLGHASFQKPRCARVTMEDTKIKRTLVSFIGRGFMQLHVANLTFEVYLRTVLKKNATVEEKPGKPVSREKPKSPKKSPKKGDTKKKAGKASNKKK